MAIVKAISKVRHDGQLYITGDKIANLSDKQAERLVSLGVAELLEEEQPELESMKVDELKKLAEEREIPGFENMKKAELIAALGGEHDGNSGS